MQFSQILRRNCRNFRNIAFILGKTVMRLQLSRPKTPIWNSLSYCCCLEFAIQTQRATLDKSPVPCFLFSHCSARTIVTLRGENTTEARSQLCVGVGGGGEGRGGAAPAPAPAATLTPAECNPLLRVCKSRGATRPCNTRWPAPSPGLDTGNAASLPRSSSAAPPEGGFLPPAEPHVSLGLRSNVDGGLFLFSFFFFLHAKVARGESSSRAAGSRWAR